jgi:hypothetical protein
MIFGPETSSCEAAAERREKEVWQSLERQREVCSVGDLQRDPQLEVSKNTGHPNHIKSSTHSTILVLKPY